MPLDDDSSGIRDPEEQAFVGGVAPVTGTVGIVGAMQFSAVVVDVVGATEDNACAFNCHCCCTCGVSIRLYLGLPWVNGIYRYLIIC